MSVGNTQGLQNQRNFLCFIKPNPVMMTETVINFSSLKIRKYHLSTSKLRRGEKQFYQIREVGKNFVQIHRPHILYCYPLIL